MKSWWELGEWSGYDGSELAIWRITCPFCKERGNFESVFQKEKRKPNSSKKLNFEVVRCGNCNGFVHVLWSSSEYSGSRGMHDFHVLPYPLGTSKAPEHWPEHIQRYWLQAAKSMEVENWDAAVVMARSALQAALRNHNAKGSNQNRRFLILLQDRYFLQLWKSGPTKSASLGTLRLIRLLKMSVLTPWMQET